MNALPKSALVAGGGIAGMSAAIRLLEEGVNVTLFDKDPAWSVYGAGITCSPLTFRALCDLGIGPAVLERGARHDVIALHDVSGNPLKTLPLPRLRGDGQPAAGGIMRPDLHAILSERVKTLGATIRLGLTIASVSQDTSGADVIFSDGSKDRFDMIIGADGLFSALRGTVLNAKEQPHFTGQACWRVMFDLPEEWDGTGAMFLSPQLKVGFTPCAPGKMYMYLLEHVPDNPWREPEALPGLLKDLLKTAGGKLADLRDSVRPETPINYRPLESVLVEGPWYKNRTVLIGDAVHATTPHLAAGAGLAVEDAIVLVQELKRNETLATAFEAFQKRRQERAKLVVSNSLKLGELEMQGAPLEEQGGLMQASTQAIASPY